MGSSGAFASLQKEDRKRERQAQLRRRELERIAKHQAKLSEREQASFEVDRFENEISLLLSVHKEAPQVLDWDAIAVSLPPPKPLRRTTSETKARLQMLPKIASNIEKARSEDDAHFTAACQNYSEELAHILQRRNLAQRVRAGEEKAYTEALIQLNPFEEISGLGSSIHFTIHSPFLIECIVKVNGKKAIPVNVKSLTSAGKVSTKPMPKSKFQEIFQDYVCGCVLRVARELFALLPVKTVLVSANMDFDHPKGEYPVLSVVFTREQLNQLPIDIDASDSMENFLHRGDLKLSRKTGEFSPIKAIHPAELSPAQTSGFSLDTHASVIAGLRGEIHLTSNSIIQRVQSLTQE